MGKWPSSPPSRKFQVAVKPIELQGLAQVDREDYDDTTTSQRFVAVKINWKGEPRFFPFRRNSAHRKQEFSGQKILNKGMNIVRWDDQDRWFENTCRFVMASNHDQKFGAWEIVFNVLYGENMGLKVKTTVIGRASLNIAEIAWESENSSVERKLPLNLQIDGISVEAILTVVLTFAEIREPLQAMATNSDGSMKPSKSENTSGNDSTVENAKGRRRSLSQEEVSLDGSDELSVSENKDEFAMETSVLTKSKSSIIPTTNSYSDKKDGWFSWKGVRFSFKRVKTKEEKSDEKLEDCCNENRIETEPSNSMDSFSNQNEDPEKPSQAECNTNAGCWEEKEIISRDGEAMLKVPVFFASFDQCSDKAAGESACTALVAVISHWLHSNSDTTPDRMEFDSLIMQGSSEWRKLCEDAAYTNDFPNRHFDLETILRAEVRPLSISHANSFVGFFGAEKFESLKGQMSFDDLWNEISSTASDAPRIYIVSWNDHFFVLKAEENAYYIIDTLGERLHEGCNQAYMLKFDDSAIMKKQAKTIDEKEEEEEEEIICRGKECCGEFIKRFLASIPLKELEEEEKKAAVSYYSLHQRLQIEFNYSYLSSSSSSLMSSPFTSTTTSSTSSPLQIEERVP